MGDFFVMVYNFYTSIFNLFSNTVFEIEGTRVSLAALIFVPLVIGLVISVFWKGSRT